MAAAHPTAAKGYPGLTARQMEELKDAFDHLDVDKDGQITTSELNTVLHLLGVPVTDADVASMMREADVDGNGTVELDEFLRLHSRWTLLSQQRRRSRAAASSPTSSSTTTTTSGEIHPESSPEPSAAAGRALDGAGGAPEDDDDDEEDAEMLREVFRVFDSDGNGVISAEELHSVLSRLVGAGDEPVTVHDCRRMIQSVDANGDGVVDFAEFRKMMASDEFACRQGLAC